MTARVVDVLGARAGVLLQSVADAAADRYVPLSSYFPSRGIDRSRRQTIDRKEKYFENRLLQRRDMFHDLSARAKDAAQQDKISQSISCILHQVAHKASDNDLKVLDEQISQSVSRSSGLRNQRRQLEREMDYIMLCMCIFIEAAENPGLAGAKLLGKVLDIVDKELVKRSAAEERWTKLD